MVDPTDAGQLPSMLEKAKRRRGLDMRGEVITSGDLALSFNLGFDDDSYRLGILKIAYELAYRVLGPAYVDDADAAGFRSLLVEESPLREPLESAQIQGQFGGLFGRPMRPFRSETSSWLLGIVFPHVGKVHAYVRLFDRFDGSFVVSNTAANYDVPSDGRGWITDVAAGNETEIDLPQMLQLATGTTALGSSEDGSAGTSGSPLSLQNSE